MNNQFPKVIVDSPSLPFRSETAHIVNIFTPEDIENLTKGDNLHCRIFDLDLLDLLEDFPVIINSHLDLSEHKPIKHSSGLAIEVSNKLDIEHAKRHFPDLLIAKSYEAPGVAKECSALVLFQLLAKQNLPYSIHACTGYQLFQSYLLMGVHGVVLSTRFLQDDDKSTIRFPLNNIESVRLHIQGGPPKAQPYRELLRRQGTLEFLRETYRAGLWESELQPKNKDSVERKIQRYLDIAKSKNICNIKPYFYEGSPAAQAFHARLPLVKGPMSGICVSADFAKAVYDAGGFPFLALASLSNEDVEIVVAKTAEKKIPFGVGIVAVSLSDENFERQIQSFERHRPSIVLIGTPQLNHIQRALKTDLNIAVHAPNLPMFKSLYSMGIRCFVIEGGDAGGHISNIGSLTVWQSILSYIVEQDIQNEVHLVFAGGIRDASAKDLITALINFYGLENSVKVSLQMGSAYLSTEEAVEFTPLSPGYQQQLIDVDDTYVTGESMGRQVRQLITPESEEIVEKEWSIYNSAMPHEEKKVEYAKLYQGGLKKAINTQGYADNASYMAGSVSALINKRINIKQLHDDLTDPAPEVTKLKESAPIAIVGIGVKLPGAESVEEHFYNTFHQRCFITDMPDGHFDRDLYLSEDKAEELKSYTSLGAFLGELDNDFSKYRIPPVIAKQLSRGQRMALEVSNKALIDAGFFEKPFLKERTAVVIGTKETTSKSLDKINWPEIKSRIIKFSQEASIDIDEILEKYEQKYISGEITEDTLPGELGNIIAARVASVFNFKGLTQTIDAACASSLAAVSQAMSLLQNNTYDVVLAGGLEQRMNRDDYIKFARIGALSGKGCFPFDSAADGFVKGEGSVIYVLKRYEDALKFGDKIYGVLEGWGSSSDGAGKAIAAPDKNGQILAMRRAYESTNISPSSIDFIECHATATNVGDQVEIESISDFFTQNNITKGPALGASKAMVGHLRCGAGAVGLLQSLFVINTRYIPGIINFRSPSFESNIEFDIPHKPKKIAHNNKIHCSVSSFGFGGTNYHMLLSSADENARHSLLKESDTEMPDYHFSGDLAWVCPGQGAQYEGMLAEYKTQKDFLVLSEKVKKIFSEYSDIDLIKLLTELDREQSDKNSELLRSTEVSQPAIFLASVVMGDGLVKLGIEPDLYIGHSLGEYSALYLSGVLSFDDAFRMVCIRGKLMSASACEDPGAMIAIMGDERVAERLIAQTERYAACANLNSYNQTVISCSQDATQDILKTASNSNIRATVLNVARGFHSELVSDCIDEMRMALETCRFYYPKALVTSNIRNQAHPYIVDSALQKMSSQHRQQSIDLLALQINHPVHFINQIQAAYQSGIRRFVEVGPKDILCRLIEQIQQGKFLQTVALNKGGKTLVDFESLHDLLVQPLGIKRTPLPKSDSNTNTKKRKKVMAVKKRSIIDEVRSVVADVSGYEVGTFEDSAEFERDLGIDTLKIFEIISKLRGTVLPEEINDFQKLNSVANIYKARDESLDVTITSIEEEKASPLDTIREVVASISGYDLDTLENEAEFERDLGIDTLKIFEIISKLRGTILPEEISDFQKLNSVANIYKARDKSLDVTTISLEEEKVSPLDTIREVVAYISGYDLDTLENEAEFERDLGIDTLKIFEIISKLRGTILPEEISDFQKLNSIVNIYKARDKSLDKSTATEKNKKELIIYKKVKHKLQFTELLNFNIDQVDIHADNDYQQCIETSKIKLLIFKVANSVDELNSRLFKLFFTKSKEFIEVESTDVIFVSYGEGALKDVTINSALGFVKSLAKDYTNAQWHYNHFDRLPKKEKLIESLCSGVGLKLENEKISIDKLQKVSGLFCERSQLKKLLSRNDHIVVTGGARGITSHLVKHLYQISEARFTLLGRKMEVEPWILSLDADRIKYVPLDIRDREAVENHKSELSDTTLLIHGAGVEYSKNFVNKSYEEFMEVIGVKVSGLFNLLDNLDQTQIRALVLFSSTAAYWGNHGQADYSTANGVLSSHINDLPCLSFGWTAWDEIGMASRGVVHQILSTKGSRFIGLDEGSDIFEAILASFLSNAYSNNSHFVITSTFPESDPLYCRESEYRHSFADLDRSVEIQVRYDSKANPELIDHKFGGKIFVPASVMLGTILVEINRVFSLENMTVNFTQVKFLSPLVVDDNKINYLRVSHDGNGYLVEEVQEKLTIPIFSLKINLSDENIIDKSWHIQRRFNETLPGLKLNELQWSISHSGLGKNFQILETLSLNQSVLKSEMDFNSSIGGELLNRFFSVSKLFEACFQVCGRCAHTLKNPNKIHLPNGMDDAFVSIEALSQTKNLQIYADFLPSNSKEARFNVLAVNQHGNLVLKIQGYFAKSAFDNPIPIINYDLFLNTPIKTKDSELIFTNISELNKTYDQNIYFSPEELSEINDLTSEKRKLEKRSGKLTCKILANWSELLENENADLSHTQVFSPEKSVKVIDAKKDSDSFVSHYSISHSEDMLVVARSPHKIGVDIEKVRSLDSVVIDSLYNDKRDEIESFLDQSIASREEKSAFPLLLFTQKEAALKAHGIGLAKGLTYAEVIYLSFSKALIKVDRSIYEVSSYYADQYIISKALFKEKSSEVYLDLAKKHYPLKQVQQRILELEERQSNSYSLNHIVCFKEQVKLDQLLNSLNELLKNHDVLRTRVDVENNRALIMPYKEFGLAMVKTQSSSYEIEEAFITKSLSYKYDLANEELFFFEIKQSKNGEILLLMNFSHLILDCLNAFILSSILLKHYSDSVNHIKSDILSRDKTTQYYELKKEKASARKKDFWPQHLQGVENFLFDKPELKTSDKVSHFKTYTDFDKAKIEAYCKSQSVTLFTGLLGFLKISFMKLYGKADIPIFIPFSSKNSENYYTLGAFTNLIPVRYPLPEEISDMNTILRGINNNIYLSIDHQNEYSDESVSADSHIVIAQVINDVDAQDNTAVDRRNVDGINAKYPVIFTFINFSEKIHLELTFNSSLVEEKQIDELVSSFMEELKISVLNDENIEFNPSEEHQQPESNTEKEVAGIWEDILKVESVSTKDNFFHLGGDSLKAVEFMKKFNHIHGEDFPLSAIFQTPTLADLAKQIDSGDRFKKIIRIINDHNPNKPSLIWFYGDARGLTKKFGDDFNIYYVNSYWETVSKSLNTTCSMYDLAKEVIDNIDDAQSLNSYYIGGFSVGAVVAFEFGKLMKERGKNVEAVLLLDPALVKLPSKSEGNFLLRTLENNVVGPIKKLKHKVIRRRRGYSEVDAMYRRASTGYTPRDYGVDVILFYTPYNTRHMLKVWQNSTKLALLHNLGEYEHTELITDVNAMMIWLGIFEQHIKAHSASSPFLELAEAAS
ncbi:MAG: 3-oxoacyl-(acyl-carrier-protein) synthase/malonyl CoA-acyl carrier protein transacylase [Cellvibrionaceae bacterium]